MEVDRVGLQVPYGHQFKTGIGKEPKPKNTDDTPPPAKAESQPDVNSNGDAQDTKGVIGLLQEGHFKGVADVRLRIIHSEKLLAMEQQQLQVVAIKKIDGLLESVGSVVETFLGADEAPAQSAEESAEQDSPDVNELQDAFTQFSQAVNLAKDEFLNSQTPSKDTLLGNLDSAFKSFVELLVIPSDSPLEMSGENGTPTNTTTELDSTNPDGQENGGTVEPIEEPQSPFQSFLENLEAAFAVAIDNLTSSLDEVKVLPELSEPKGNGVAYDKFLAIYNEL